MTAPSSLTSRSARRRPWPRSGVKSNHWRSAAGSPVTTARPSAPPLATAFPLALISTRRTPRAFHFTVYEPSAPAVTVASVKGTACPWWWPDQGSSQPEAVVLLGPLLEVFRNTAALALLPVFVLLLGIGETSKVSIVVYACVWPILLNTISAVGNADPTLVKLARSMDLSTPRLFQKVILPASVPAIFTGIRLAGAVSILVLVAAEMIGAKAGLGYLINASQFNFAIPQMYAGIVTISAIGVAFNQLLVTIERRLSLWRVPA
ncbi:ABC transporter permease [Streptomyces cirratus]